MEVCRYEVWRSGSGSAACVCARVNKGFARRQQEFMGWEVGGMRYGSMRYGRVRDVGVRAVRAAGRRGAIKVG